MAENRTRKPSQKRSIETREKIIDAGFDLICTDGYFNTDTAKIAKKQVYQLESFTNTLKINVIFF